MIFPRPYPDELLGSLLIRASHHLGLQPRQLARVIGVDASTLANFLVPWGLSRIATLTATPVEELLIHNTLFPYICLMWDKKPVERLRAQILATDPQAYPHFRACFAARRCLTTMRRYCPDCVDIDRKTYGECYWHRAHIIPGVLVCPAHHRTLVSSDIPVLAKLRDAANKLPNEIVGTTVDWQTSSADLIGLATAAANTVSLEPGAWMGWTDLYPEILYSNGYASLNRRSVRRKLALDVETAIGLPFLAKIGLPARPHAMKGWPIGLVQGVEPIMQATFVHLLFRRFLHLA